MTYDPAKTTRLIRQTDLAGSHATLAEIERVNQLQACTDELARVTRENAALRKAAQPLADMAALHALYEGPPCHNACHKDSDVVCYAQHGDTEVSITLGQCRKVAKLLNA